MPGILMSDRKISFWKRLRYRLEWLAAQGAYTLISLIPRSLMNPLSRVLGLLAYRLDAKDRKIALANLEYAYGKTLTPAQRESIARSSMQNFTRVLLDSFWCRNLSFDNISRYVHFDPESLKLYDSLVKQGKGVILIGMHHGNWEWMSLGIGFMKRPVNIVVQELRNKLVDDLFNIVRTRAGHRLIYRDGAGVKLFKALKRGETLGLLIDLNIHEYQGAIACHFFNRWVQANPIPVELSLRTGAPLLVMTTYWHEDGHYRAEFGPVINSDFDPSLSREVVVRLITQRYLDTFEGIIRQNPERWLWSYKRWKFRPDREISGHPWYSRYSPLLEKAARESVTQT